MKILDEIKKEYAKENGCTSWRGLTQYDLRQQDLDIVAKRYALEACRETLKNAVNHVDVDDFEHLHKYGKCFKNVLSEDNIPQEVKP